MSCRLIEYNRSKGSFLLLFSLITYKNKQTSGLLDCCRAIINSKTFLNLTLPLTSNSTVH